MTSEEFVNAVICVIMFVWIAMAFDAIGRF